MIYITLFICWLAVLQATAQVKNGADRLEELFPLLENKRISLVVNQRHSCISPWQYNHVIQRS